MRVTIGVSKHGRGVFAAVDIPKDEVILRFTGPVITLEQALAAGPDNFNPLQIGPCWYIDTEWPGVFVNHSCEPNAGIRGDVFLVALHPIPQGEEVFFDYSTTMSEKIGQMECHCGMPSCRRIIGDFHDLPPDLKLHYLQVGIVQSFIVQEYHGYSFAPAVNCKQIVSSSNLKNA